MSPLLGGKSERAVDDHATQLAHFAVTEIGQKTNADLSLVRVSKLSTQVVAGIKYYFDLETKDKAGHTKHFEAQVWEKPVRGALAVGSMQFAAPATKRACRHAWIWNPMHYWAHCACFNLP